jgi:hypothetical protein
MNPAVPFFDPREIRGCRPADLLSLEAALNGGHIPESVRAHLLSKGRKMAWFHPVSECSFPGILSSTRDLHQRWRKTTSFPGIAFEDELPSDAIVLLANGGYQWWWISCADGPDPTVYFYEHGGDANRFHAMGHFSAWAMDLDQWMQHEFELFLPCVVSVGEAAFRHVISLVCDVLGMFDEVQDGACPRWDVVRGNYERLSFLLYQALLGKKAIVPVRPHELNSLARVDHLLPDLAPRTDISPERLLALSEEVREAIRACGFR